MRKIILVVSLLMVATMVYSASNFWIKNSAGATSTKVTTTTTDTTQTFNLDYAENAVLEIFVDEKGSSTFTIECDILAPRADGTLFLVRDTAAVISGATADAYARIILRRPGMLVDGISGQAISNNIIAVKRVMTLTAGDSIYVQCKLSTW